MITNKYSKYYITYIVSLVATHVFYWLNFSSFDFGGSMMFILWNCMLLRMILSVAKRKKFKKSAQL